MTEIEYMRLNGWTYWEIAEAYNIKFNQIGIEHVGVEDE